VSETLSRLFHHFFRSGAWSYLSCNVIVFRFLIKRILEVVVGCQVVMSLFQQWMIPSVKNSLIPFSVSTRYYDISRNLLRCFNSAPIQFNPESVPKNALQRCPKAPLINQPHPRYIVLSPAFLPANNASNDPLSDITCFITQTNYLSHWP